MWEGQLRSKMTDHEKSEIRAKKEWKSEQRDFVASSGRLNENLTHHSWIPLVPIAWLHILWLWKRF